MNYYYQSKVYPFGNDSKISYNDKIAGFALRAGAQEYLQECNVLPWAVVN